MFSLIVQVKKKMYKSLPLPVRKNFGYRAPRLPPACMQLPCHRCCPTLFVGTMDEPEHNTIKTECGQKECLNNFEIMVRNCTFISATPREPILSSTLHSNLQIRSFAPGVSLVSLGNFR